MFFILKRRFKGIERICGLEEVWDGDKEGNFRVKSLGIELGLEN